MVEALSPATTSDVLKARKRIELQTKTDKISFETQQPGYTLNMRCRALIYHLFRPSRGRGADSHVLVAPVAKALFRHVPVILFAQ